MVINVWSKPLPEDVDLMMGQDSEVKVEVANLAPYVQCKGISKASAVDPLDHGYQIVNKYHFQNCNEYLFIHHFYKYCCMIIE